MVAIIVLMLFLLKEATIRGQQLTCDLRDLRTLFVTQRDQHVSTNGRIDQVYASLEALTQTIQDLKENINSVTGTDGGWGPWTDWTTCYPTCSTGLKSRQRSCDNPKPSNGGAYCIGSPFDVSLCNQQSCSRGEYYGTSFITGFMKTLPPDTGVPTLMFACPENTAVINISISALNIINATYTLTGNTLQLAFSEDIVPQSYGEIGSKGVFITTDRPVMLFSGSFGPRSSDGSLVPPEVSLGTDYVTSGHPTSRYGTDEFLIVGTANRTTLKITVNSVEEKITLNRLETYMRAAIDLSGTRITASAPVYVLSGHFCANIPNNETVYCDYIDEAIPPISSLGTVHIVSFMKPRPDFTISIVSSKPDTPVTIYDSLGNTIEHFTTTTVFRTYTSFQTLSMVSSQPVLVTQYGHGSNRTGGDPSMMVIPDVSHFGHRYDFVVPENFSNPSTISIVMSEAYSSSGLLLNDQLFIPTQTLVVTVPGNGKYYVLYGNATAGYNRLTHVAGRGATFGAWLYGFTIYHEYAWSLGHT